MKTSQYMLIAVMQSIVVKGQGPASLSITNVQVGYTASFVCSFPELSAPIAMHVIQDNTIIYLCANIAFTCNKKNSDTDYSEVDFTDLRTPSAKATFTIANVNKARDKGIWKCSYGTDESNTVNFGICNAPDVTDNCTVTSNSTTATYTPNGGYRIKGDVSRTCDSDGKWSGSTPTCEAPTPAVLSVQNVAPGDTATFECSYSSITSTPSLEIRKDNELIYDCANIINFTCSALRRDNDYSDVTFIGIGTTSVKGTFTVDNADQIRDGGSWVCKYGSSLESVPVIFVVQDKQVLYWLFILVVIPGSGLVVVIIIVSGYKTLVISPLYVKVTKNTCQLSWKPKFKHVPDTTYAKCGPNGLTEHAELIDGLFVVVFRDLIPERQHDVTVYCQHAEDMKLYKSETCVVFTLKDFSNAHPKERKPVLALQSLDLKVYQRKVELSWTSPIAFDSTKVEYWFGSEQNITMSANKTSLATSNAELTRLLPERMITFIIIGEKDGTKYPTGLLCQKTLKD